MSTPSYLDIIKSEAEPESGKLEAPQISKIQSYLAAPAKGALREIGKQIRNFPGLQGSLKGTGLVQSEEEAEELLNKLSPQPDDIISRSLERGGKNLPYALMGGPLAAEQAVGRSIGAGVVGQGLEEVGAPPWLQALGETAVFAAPKFRQAINPTQGQQAQVDFLRRMGLSEAEIAPAIQGETKQRLLSRMSPRRGRAQRALQATRRALGRVYNQLRARPEAQQLMSPQQANLFANEVAAVTNQWPAALRDAVRQDAADLARSGFTGDNLINFWQDLNHTQNLGLERVGTLKGPISNALDSLSPQLGHDFRMTNDIYGNFSRLGARLRPGLAHDLIQGLARLTRGGRVLFGVMTGNYPLLIESVGEEGLKHLSREMLINPRFQNLTRQIITAVNEGRYVIANKLADKIGESLSKVDKEAAKEIEDTDFRKIITKDQGRKRPKATRA